MLCLKAFRFPQYWGSRVIMISHGLLPHWSDKVSCRPLAQFSGAKRPLDPLVVCVSQWLIDEPSWIIGPRPGSHLTLVTWILISHPQPPLMVMYYLSYYFIHLLGLRMSVVCIGFYVPIQPRLVDHVQQKRWKQSFFTVSF